MDMDTNTAARGASEVTDETRLSAATKRVTLTPLHTDVQPDLKPDGSAGGEGGMDIPIANVPSDMESTSTATLPTPEATATNNTTTPVAAQPAVATPTVSAPVAAATAPAASFLPTTAPVTKHSKLPFVIAGVAVAAVVVGVMIYFVF